MFSHLDKFVKYQYLIGITILIPVRLIGSSIQLLMLIVDTMHSPIYQTLVETPRRICLSHNHISSRLTPLCYLQLPTI